MQSDASGLLQWMHDWIQTLRFGRRGGPQRMSPRRMHAGVRGAMSVGNGIYLSIAVDDMQEKLFIPSLSQLQQNPIPIGRDRAKHGSRIRNGTVRYGTRRQGCRLRDRGVSKGSLVTGPKRKDPTASSTRGRVEETEERERERKEGVVLYYYGQYCF